MDLTAKDNSLGNDSAITGVDSEQTVLVQGAASDEMTAKAGKDTKRILIVDDEQDFLRIISLELRVNGYEVVSATDAVTAISRAQEENPDLILLDLGLPAGDGFTVMQRLTFSNRTVLTPVIVITGRDQSTAKKETLEAGATAFLQKPVDFDELLAVIKNIFAESVAKDV